MLAWQTGENTYDHLYWDLGALVASHLPIPAPLGTPDQHEDVFYKRHPEMRPHYAAPELIKYPTLEILFCGIGAILFLGLLSYWPRSSLVIKDPTLAFLWICFSMWPLLAMATWWSPDIFQMLRYSAVLGVPTLFVAARALRLKL